MEQNFQLCLCMMTTCDIIIDKLEPIQRDTNIKSAKSSRETHVTVTRTRLINAYPYLVNDITVNKFSNQPIRFQATFYYAEYSVVDEDE